MYDSVEAWLKAERPDLLGIFNNPGSSDWWKKTIANELPDSALRRWEEHEANTGSATYRWCSAMLDARKAGKLPAPTS